MELIGVLLVPLNCSVSHYLKGRVLQVRVSMFSKDAWKKLSLLQHPHPQLYSQDSWAGRFPNLFPVEVLSPRKCPQTSFRVQGADALVS